MPYASHVPFETWIIPRRQQASFGSVEPGQLLPLAELKEPRALAAKRLTAAYR
jgi:hypothetical protein